MAAPDTLDYLEDGRPTHHEDEQAQEPGSHATFIVRLGGLDVASLSNFLAVALVLQTHPLLGGHFG
jgi:hypothetical protein